MKPLSTSIYTFADLMAGGYLYVDKTEQILRLIAEYKGQYFLSRPRRFGKSLLVSTLKAIFQGRRELFKGLWIDQSDYDWATYPVIHLDMGSCVADSADKMEQSLMYLLDTQAAEYDMTLTQKNVSDRFRELVDRHAEKGKVVILVDEYDKPLLGLLGQPEVRAIQRLMKTFYGVIKTTEASQRFALITGVSKFTKVSIFSDLNNLTDLTMRRDAATLLGYTQEELEASFPDYIDALAAQLGMSRDAALDELRLWYNGYRFEEHAPTVYNPVSVMKCFQELKFKNYWFETGTPRFLVDLMHDQPVDLDDLDVQETSFSAYDPERLDPLPLLVQTGYLTIQRASLQGRVRLYRLGYPNYEIEEAFSLWLAEGFCHAPQQDLNSALQAMVRAMEAGRPAEMLERMRIFFSKVPNTISLKNEKYYQTIFYTIFTMIGAMTEAEVSTHIGRIDATVKTSRHIYIFEFKLGGTAAAAMAQIRARRYDQPYLDDGREVLCIGVAFDRESRNLGEVLIETADGRAVPGRVEEDFDIVYETAVDRIIRRMREKGFDPALIEELTGGVGNRG